MLKALTGPRNLPINLFILGCATVVGIAWMIHDPASSRPSEPDIPMSANARDTLLNLTTQQAQTIINTNGKACPMVTGGQIRKFADTGEPYVVASCSDGSRYVVSWRNEKGQFGALSCSWGVC